MADEALYYGTGRRKNAVARVRLVPGTGKVTINGRDGQEYFGREALFNYAMTPFKVTDTTGHFDVKARIDGGGVSGQAGALRHGISRALLEAGDMAEAVRCLGHPHVLTGPVVSGRHLGRTIGIPTANLALPPQLLCPRHGVYAALACFDGRRLPAVVNIGSRPTVGGTHVTVEPWILDFDGDLYGRTLRLEFYTFLRPERKFDSLDELRAAILHNAEQTREFFRDR